jgi:hypothetical protein
LLVLCLQVVPTVWRPNDPNDRSKSGELTTDGLTAEKEKGKETTTAVR